MLRSPALPTRRKAVKTYGRASRSKAASFKVFQDAVDRDGTEKKSWPAITSSPPIIGQQIPGSISDIDLADDLDDPFADPLSLSSIRSKIPDSTATLHHNDKNVLKATALREKSTNHPILIRSSAATRETPEASTASLLRQNTKNHQTKKQKFNNTPRIISDAKTPLRPRKNRYFKPTYEQRDFLATQSPTKTRGYIGQENESDGTYSEGLTALGTPASDMEDNASTTSVTWVRERARGIFSGTRKAAGKIMGIAPPNAKYREQKEERSKLKDIIKNGARKSSHGAMNNHLQVVQKENIDFQAGHANDVFKKNKGSVSLHDYLREPLSHPEDCQNKGSGDEDPLGLHIDPSRRKNFWKSENIQDLLMLGSAKVKYAKKQKDYSSKYPTGNEDPSSFQTSVNTSPQGSVYDLSDNGMPSSNLLLKYTPNKEQHYPRSKKTSNTDSCRDMHMDDLLNEGSSDEGNGTTKCGGDELLGENIEYKEEVEGSARYTENKHLILRAASSEDELCQVPYDCQALNVTKTFKGVIGNEGEHTWRGIGSSYKTKNVKALGTPPTTKTIGDSSEKESHERRKHGKDIIHVGGSRTSRYVPKGPKVKGVVEGAGKKTDRSNRARIPLKKKSSGKIGKGGVSKEARKQKPSRGYGRLEDDDMDELQMDLPSMMI